MRAGATAGVSASLSASALGSEQGATEDDVADEGAAVAARPGGAAAAQKAGSPDGAVDRRAGRANRSQRHLVGLTVTAAREGQPPPGPGPRRVLAPSLTSHQAGAARRPATRPVSERPLRGHPRLPPPPGWARPAVVLQ